MALTPRANITNTRFHYSSTKNLGGKLKYLQYRDQADKHIPQIDPDGNKIQRWTDVGLGKDQSEIMENLRETQTRGYRKNVLARTVVISPAINFMQAIPPERQIDVIQELTQTTISNWFIKMDVKQPEYSFVTHIAESDEKRPNGREKDVEGKQPFLHTHVMLAATGRGIGRDRENYRVEKDGIEMLHEAGIEAMEEIWTRELGREKVQELNQDLEAMAREHQELDAARDLANKEPELSEEEFTKLLEQASPAERDAILEDFLEQLKQDFQKNLEQRLQEERQIEDEEFPDNKPLELESSDELDQETLLQPEETPNISEEASFATPEDIAEPKQETLDLAQLLEEFKADAQTAASQEIEQEPLDSGQMLAEMEEEREETAAPSFSDLSQILAEMDEEKKPAPARAEISQDTELADLLAEIQEENSLEAYLQALDQEQTNPEIDNPQIDDQYPDL